jgi:hypothetical protein
MANRPVLKGMAGARSGAEPHNGFNDAANQKAALDIIAGLDLDSDHYGGKG